METLIRLTSALGIFCIMIAWEYLSPRRRLSIGRKQRWPVNLGLAAVNMLIMRLTIGSMAYFSAVAAAAFCRFFKPIDGPEWLSISMSLLVLDVAIYGQHIVMHKWPVLWRLHQVHHTDLEFDATTAVRFHPLEIVLSMAYKVVCIYLLGANPIAVVAFEIILNGAATFNHSNIYIPPALDKILRWLIITPDMHRIHHSARTAETDSNYGFSISCWDRLFKTYTAEPGEPQTAMDIGLKSYRRQSDLRFIRLLLLPFRSLKDRRITPN